jgi:Tol biopolymer transport system component
VFPSQSYARQLLTNGKYGRLLFMMLVAIAFLGVMAGASGAAAGDTTRVSVDSSGAQGNGSSGVGVVSADGRYVAFNSSASNLVADDTNTAGDVFVRDLDTGTTERVSVDSSETEGNGHIRGSSMSTDGRYVVFTSDSTNLVDDDTNGKTDIFVRDRDAGTTERVSVDNFEDQTGNQFVLSISDDGRYVAFSSQNNLVDDDTNGKPDVFVHDRDTGTTERVSVSSSETQANDFGFNNPEFGSMRPIISADGRYVAFTSTATDLVAGDTNGGDDAFVRDRQLGTTERVTVDSCGKERENTASYYLVGLSMSDDGRYVSFGTYARNLVAGDTGVSSDVFVHDRNTGKTERASVTSSGASGDSSSSGGTVSADGRYVAFNSNSTNLVSGDTNWKQDVFVHERDPNKPNDCIVPPPPPPPPPGSTAPKVDTVSPVDETTRVARSTNVKARFSEKMEPDSITKSTFKLYKCSSTTSTDCSKQVTKGTVQLSSDGLTATLDPYGTSDTKLAKKTKYKATVNTEAKDMEGNALDQQKDWYFTTR